jgi:Tautomerase enzyme
VRDCAVPADDRFQVFTVHSSQALIYDESFLAMHRTDGIVVAQVTSTLAELPNIRSPSISVQRSCWRKRPE